MKRQTRILLIAVLALLLVAAVAVGVTLHDRAAPAPSDPVAAQTTPPAADKETPTPEPSESPEESETPEATATPEPSDAPSTPTPAPSDTPTPDPTPETKTVTVTIVCSNALASPSLPESVRALLPAGGVMLQRSVELQPGDTAWSVTQRVCREAGLAIESHAAAAQNAVYVEGIGQLYEFDCGEGSGWIYKVNGTAPGRGCDQCALNAGDRLVWAYTCNYGNDV